MGRAWIERQPTGRLHFGKGQKQPLFFPSEFSEHDVPCVMATIRDFGFMSAAVVYGIFKPSQTCQFRISTAAFETKCRVSI